jgi:hypothetical protein
MSNRKFYWWVFVGGEFGGPGNDPTKLEMAIYKTYWTIRHIPTNIKYFLMNPKFYFKRWKATISLATYWKVYFWLHRNDVGGKELK